VLSLVPTPIGNIGDISLRAIELLSEADTLLCEDTRVTKKLIHILKERYNTVFKENQTFISLHSHNEKEFIKNLEVSFFDADNGLQKVSPLLGWTHKEVWDYIGQHDVPYNKLHDQFYPSLGCAPCTRFITPGEDVRAGRWWWENPENKECGLHAGNSSTLKPHPQSDAKSSELKGSVKKV